MPSKTPTSTSTADLPDAPTVDLGALRNGDLDALHKTWAAPWINGPRHALEEEPRHARAKSASNSLPTFAKFGRQLRYLAGVDEALMDRVPQERSYYSSLGAIVIGTATIAAFSMWFAVCEAVGESSIGALVPALIWFLFIIVFDRWIVSSRPVEAWQKLLLFVTRLSVAVLVGIVVAEPLVLRVFQTAIEARVVDDRASAIQAMRSRLTACNPDPADKSAGPAPASCTDTGDILSLPASPAGQDAQLASLQERAKTLRATIVDETNQLNALNKKSTDECAGHKGEGLTGHVGDGINCKQDKQNALQYFGTHPIEQQQQQLAELDKQIALLETAVTDSRSTFGRQRDAAINARVGKLPQPDAKIGLIERLDALAELTAGSFTLTVAAILIRLLFIMIDCAPVLMKMSGGNTRYDELVKHTLDDAVETHALELRGKDNEREMLREEQEQRRREHAIHMEERLANAVDERARVYERQAANGVR
ncbi:DUF4407 domain-containing protein [Dactylosporangium sp. NPDC051485]|uniref:DUF4407 domain-containing protein n=1 Tax=Dactylosporangium sp. NPDC051485 TaxID=3154846 RepID=UPI0034201FB7